MRFFQLGAWLMLGALSACSPQQPAAPRPTAAPPAPTASAAPTPAAPPIVYTFEVVRAYPHDANAFTQGLVFHEGSLYESTGRYGQSSLRQVALETGRVVRKKEVSADYFAEGLAIFGERLYQLTWQNQRAFVYDLKSFRLVKELAYGGEGWGLTHDGESLILSDGTNRLRFLDPETFAVRRTIEVFDRGAPLNELNELEYVNGEVFANIWQTDRIVRLDPTTGRLRGWIDLTGLLPSAERRDPEAVLNGIAYDAALDRLFVTGKLWPKIFEIKLKERGSR